MALVYDGICTPEEAQNASKGISKKDSGLNGDKIKQLLKANGIDDKGNVDALRKRLKDLLESAPTTPAKAAPGSPVFTPDDRRGDGTEGHYDSERRELQYDIGRDCSRGPYVDSDDDLDYAQPEPDAVGEYVTRGQSRIDAGVAEKRLAGLVKLSFHSNPDKTASGMLMHLAGRSCVITNHHAIRNAIDARDAYIDFDVEIGAKSKNQKCKDLLSPDDDEQFEHRQKGYGGNKNIQNGLLFVRLYRPFDITICQFADGRSANHERKKAAECEFEPYAMEPGDDIRILQHPLGKPTIQSCGKVLAARDVSDLTKHPKKRSGLPAPGNMEYDASTLPGSSGSPIFDASDDWKLLGIHHCNISKGVNGGTSIAAIMAELKRLETQPVKTGPFAGETSVTTEWTGYPGRGPVKEGRTIIQKAEEMTCQTPAAWLWDGSVDNLPEDKGYDDVAIQNAGADDIGDMQNKKYEKLTEKKAFKFNQHELLAEFFSVDTKVQPLPFWPDQIADMKGKLEERDLDHAPVDDFDEAVNDFDEFSANILHCKSAINEYTAKIKAKQAKLDA